MGGDLVRLYLRQLYPPPCAPTLPPKRLFQVHILQTYYFIYSTFYVPMYPQGGQFGICSEGTGRELRMNTSSNPFQLSNLVRILDP